MDFRLFKRMSLSVIMIIIILGAHWLKSDIYGDLQKVGLDLSMTPFTNDMIFMESEKEIQEPYYKSDFILYYSANNIENSVNVGEMGFYEFKLPFQWLVECQQRSKKCIMAYRFLCKSVSDYAKDQIDYWRVELRSKSVQGKAVGFGMNNQCIK